MSELNDFADKLASVLEKMAADIPETASVPGAPFYLTMIEMGKSAKAKHARTKLAVPFGGLWAGLAGAGKGLVSGWGAGVNARTLAQASKLMPAGIDLAEMKATTEMAAALRNMSQRGLGDVAEAATRGMTDDAIGRLMQNVPGLQGGAQAGKAVGIAGQQALQQGAGASPWQLPALGLGGLAGGLYLGRDRGPAQNTLPQIVRYG